MFNITNRFEHRPSAKPHLQYLFLVVEPLCERCSDTWIVFELAKRLGFGDRFWNGDIEAGYAYELAPSGISLEQLKDTPGGISQHIEPTHEKHAKLNKDRVVRGFPTPSKKVELYCHKFAAHGYPPMPEYVEPALTPVTKLEIAAGFLLVLTNATFTTFVHSPQMALRS